VVANRSASKDRTAEPFSLHAELGIFNPTVRFLVEKFFPSEKFLGSVSINGTAVAIIIDTTTK
jgi:hypothetical protein